MEDKLKSEIANIVETIFAGKKEEDMRQRTEDALRESANTLEVMAAELTAEKDKAVELESKVASLEEALKVAEAAKEDSSEDLKKTAEELTEEVASLKKELQEKSEVLDNILKDALAGKRMEELVVAGVARDNKEEQSLKVREMSEEAFASYKEELESIRKAILSELQKKQEETAAAEAAEAAAKEALEGGTIVVTPPANVDPAKSVSAALNMEANPSDDLTAKYADLGIAMAEAMKKDK